MKKCLNALLLAFSIGFASPILAFAADEANSKEDIQKNAPENTSEAVDDEKYFELLTLFADTLDQVERNYVTPISRRELMEAAIEGVLKKLDPYSDYIAPEDLDAFRTGVENQFGGIGIRINIQNDRPTVITPLIGTPAYKGGILAGDEILEIDGTSTKGMSTGDAAKKMKGALGTSVTLKVLHKHDKSTEDITLQRASVEVETVLGYKRNADDSWEFVIDKDQKIGYIRLTAFSRGTTERLKEVLILLKEREIKSLVLDLRFNPGGLLSSAIGIADLFLNEGEIVSTEGRNTPKRSWSATKRGTFDNFELAVLVNHYSASASEIVAACLQDHNRAVVVGERTWGKGSVQNIIELEGGKSALKLTTAGYQRPNGKNIHRFDGAGDDDDWGVKPNEGFDVAMTLDEVQQFYQVQAQLDIVANKGERTQIKFDDRQLEKALDYLKKQLAVRD